MAKNDNDDTRLDPSVVARNFKKKTSWLEKKIEEFDTPAEERERKFKALPLWKRLSINVICAALFLVVVIFTWNALCKLKDVIMQSM